MTTLLNRRSVLAGSLAIGAAAWALGPSPAARADVLDYTSRAAFDVAEQAYFDQGFHDNETGGYAWGASYYMLSLLRMYETYHDEDYLQRFERYARQLVETTDHQRHVKDYQGRSGWVWRTAGNYTAGHGVIAGADGSPAVQLRWAWVYPDQSTATISNSSGDTFDLAIYNPFRGTKTLTGVTLDPASEHYVVKAVNDLYTPNLRWTAVDLRDQPVAQPAPTDGTIAFEAQHYVFAVHTGMVAYPLARYVRMVRESRKLRDSTHRGFAEWLLPIVRMTVAYHDEEFHVREGGIGDYVFPKGAPIPFDGTIEPYNQSQAMGQAFVELYRATGDTAYRDKVAAMLAGYRAGLRLGDNGAYTWTYWPVYSQVYAGYTVEQGLSTYTPWMWASRQIEDISHAAISTEFVHAAFDAQFDAQTKADVTRFAATYTENVITGPDTVSWQVNGSGNPGVNAAQCARWVEYAEQDYRVYDNALAVWNTNQYQPNQGSHALAIAYLNWAKNKAWESQ